MLTQSQTFYTPRKTEIVSQPTQKSKHSFHYFMYNSRVNVDRKINSNNNNDNNNNNNNNNNNRKKRRKSRRVIIRYEFSLTQSSYESKHKISSAIR